MEFWQAVAFLETEQLVEVAKAAEELGFTGIVASDHVVYPKDLRSPYPYTPDGSPLWSPETPWPDPWCLISAMAAATERLRFTTSVYIAPARDPFTVAKLVATAAVISANRVSLGVGAGWMREEFDLLGQDYTNRGRRLDEMIDVLRTLWSGGWVEYHGDHYDVPPLQINPSPTEPIPILCGGVSDAAIRRAVTRCDGWLAEGARDADEVVDWVTRVRAERSRTDRADEPFQIIAAVGAAPDPALYERLGDAGVDGIICAPWMTASVETGSFRSPLPAKIDAMADFAGSVIEPMR